MDLLFAPVPFWFATVGVIMGIIMGLMIQYYVPRALKRRGLAPSYTRNAYYWARIKVASSWKARISIARTMLLRDLDTLAIAWPSSTRYCETPMCGARTVLRKCFRCETRSASRKEALLMLYSRKNDNDENNHWKRLPHDLMRFFVQNYVQ